MQKTNMNLSNGIDAEMLMEWGMSPDGDRWGFCRNPEGTRAS